MIVLLKRRITDCNYHSLQFMSKIDDQNEIVFRLLQLQWKQNVEEASRLINKALDVDDKCEFAYETLGTIEIQR